MTVPFQHFAGNAGVVLQAVDYAGNASRERNSGVGNAVAHCIAGTDLYRYAAFLRQLHEFGRKRHYEAVEIGSCDILEVASRTQPRFYRVGDDADVLVQSLLSCKPHFVEDMVVGTAHEYARFFYADVAYKREIRLCGTDPCGYLREVIAKLHALFEGFSVLFGVNEELGLTDNAVLSAELVEQFIDMHHLIGGVGSAGLLTVTECGVGYVYLLRHIHRDTPVVVGDLRYLGIREHLAEQFRFRDVLEVIHIRILLEQIALVAERDFGHFYPLRFF